MKYERWIKDWKTSLAENFFLRILIILLAIGFILNASFLRSKERVVFTPPNIEQEMWIEANKASPEYLEQMAIFFATLAGNLSPGNAEYNVRILSNYCLPSKYNEVKAELASQASYIRKNNIQQSFFPKLVHLDEKKAKVQVEGDVYRNIGTTKISQEKMVFHVTFKMKKFKLYIDEFYVDYPERDKRILQRKGELSETVDKMFDKKDSSKPQ